jgi:hypothetical protein
VDSDRRGRVGVSGNLAGESEKVNR